MIERDASGGRVDNGRAVVALLLGVEELEDSFGRRDAGLHHVDHGRQLGQRLRVLARVLDERLDVADAHRARGHPQPAEQRDHHVVEVAEEHHRGLDDPGDELRPVRRLEQFVVLLVERCFDVGLATEHLDQRVPGEHFFHLGVEGPRVAPLVNELDLGALGDQANGHDGQRHGEQRDQREWWRDREHHDQHAEDGERRREQLAHCLLETLGEVVDVVGDAAEHVAAGLAIYVPQRHPMELRFDVRSQMEHRSLHHTREQVRLEVGERGGDDVDTSDEEQHAVQIADVDAPTADDAVHDDVGGVA